MVPTDFLALSTKDGLYWPFGLDMFHTDRVLAAFAVGAVLQALIVGRSLGLSWLKSFGVALAVNGLWLLFLLWFCLAFRFGGSPTPNPTGFAVRQFVHLGLVHLLLLSPFWWFAASREPSYGAVVLRMGLAQALFAPLGLLLVLTPDRPYQQLERVTGLRRMIRLVSATQVMKSPLPVFASPTEFVAKLGLHEDVARSPRFPRWATRDEGPVTLEVNPALSGRKLGGPSRIVWFYRYRYLNGVGKPSVRERYINLSTGQTQPPPD